MMATAISEGTCENVPVSHTTFATLLADSLSMVCDLEKMSDDINETLTGGTIPYPTEKQESEGLIGSFEDLFCRLSRVRRSLMKIEDTIK